MVLPTTFISKMSNVSLLSGHIISGKYKWSIVVEIMVSGLEKYWSIVVKLWFRTYYGFAVGKYFKNYGLGRHENIFV